MQGQLHNSLVSLKHHEALHFQQDLIVVNIYHVPEELCPLIDESDFDVQIFKDVATVCDLTPQGTPVNLDKFHYSVTESAINAIKKMIFFVLLLVLDMEQAL